jgi:hypothetical protein
VLFECKDNVGLDLASRDTNGSEAENFKLFPNINPTLLSLPLNCSVAVEYPIESIRTQRNFIFSWDPLHQTVPFFKMTKKKSQLQIERIFREVPRGGN